MATSEVRAFNRQDLERAAVIAPTAEAFAHDVVRGVLLAASHQVQGKAQGSVKVELACSVDFEGCGKPFHGDLTGPHGCIQVSIWPKGSEKPCVYCVCYGPEFEN